MNIKIIIFDLGGVLFTNGTKRMRKFLRKEYLLNNEALLSDIFYGENANLLRTGKIKFNTFWRIIENVLLKEKVHISKYEFTTLWYGFYTPQRGIFELVKKLHIKYKLGVISGNIQERVEFLNRKYNFRKYFNRETYSFSVGINKPNIRIYEAFLDKINIPAENCLYIDDKDIFLMPAKKLGMNVLLFKNVDQLVKDLRQLKLIE